MDLLAVVAVLAACAAVAWTRLSSGSDAAASVHVPTGVAQPATGIQAAVAALPGSSQAARGLKRTDVVSGPSRPPAAAGAPDTLATRAAAAVEYAGEQLMTSSIAVLDTHTGRLVTAGDPDQEYPGASVVKTMIATRLLVDGEMSGRDADLAWNMITRSDNDAANTLYKVVGADTLVPWIEAHYGIAHLGEPPAFPTFWGSTRITAGGLVRYYAAVRRDDRVWPWLSDAMHHYEARTPEGEPNNYGFAAALPDSAVKNGWNVYRDRSLPHDAQFNSTGFVSGDRFAVAILSEGPGTYFFAKGQSVVTLQALLLLPIR